MASIDEAYLDVTGTERLLGPPLVAAHSLHNRMKQETGLNCSIGIAGSRVVAKVCSDQAKPNGILYVLPGMEASVLAPLDVRRLPGVGKVMEQKLAGMGITRIGQLATLDTTGRGAWMTALAEKAQGRDAGGWYDEEIGEGGDPKSISHEHTFNRDERDRQVLETMLSRLSEMVCRRLREHHLHARTIQLKLRYKDFTTITRAHTFSAPTQLDTEVFGTIRDLFRRNWHKGAEIRLLGVQMSGFENAPAEQLGLLVEDSSERMRQALGAMDKLRDKFGERAVSLASGMKAGFRERTHENPAAIPGKSKKKD
jgi:DNA polymerase-4